MADPTTFEVSYSFAGYQAMNPADPLPAMPLDTQFADIALSITETVEALKDIRREDGELANGIVGPDQLSPALNLGFRPRGQWAEGVEYNTGDSVYHDDNFYTARRANTAIASTRPDLNEEVWILLFNVPTSIGNMAASVYDPANIAADIFDRANHTGSQAISTIAGLQAALNDITARLDANEATLASVIHPGLMVYDASNTVPSGWLRCDGAAVSRTTYAALFDRIGTTFGAGDGATTFNLPELRGEFVRGLDNGRGVDTGRTLGSTQAQAIQSHNHSGTTGSGGSHNHDTLNNFSTGSASGGTGASVWRPTGDPVSVGTTGAHTHSFTTNSTGGTETRPRNVAFPVIIKT